MSPSGSAGMMPLETRPHIRLDHGDAAGHFGNLETACVHRTGRRGRNGCAEHKSPVVLGPLTAHGVADTCTEEREYHLDPGAAEWKCKGTAGECGSQTEHQQRIAQVG